MSTITCQYFGKRPHLQGKRLLVATIAKQVHLSEWTPAQAALYFKVSEAEISAALDYYADHKFEIDLQEMSEEARLGRRFCEG